MENHARSTRARASAAHVVLASLVSLVLAACGSDAPGGGGPAPITAPTAAVSISAANGEQVAATAVEIALGGAGLAQVMPIGVEAELDAAPARRVVSRLTSDALRRASEAAGATPTVTGAVYQTNCAESGTFTTDETQTSSSITFNACSDYPGEVVNGTIALTNLVETGTTTVVQSATVSLDVTVTEGSASMRIAGAFSVEATTTPSTSSSSFQISGSFLGYTDGVTSHVLSNFDLLESYDGAAGLWTYASNYTLASTAIGGRVTVAMPTSFKAYDLYYPHEGVLVVTGGGGGKVSLTVSGNELAASPQVRIDIDSNGDGVLEATVYRDWVDLAAE